MPCALVVTSRALWSVFPPAQARGISPRGQQERLETGEWGAPGVLGLWPEDGGDAGALV